MTSATLSANRSAASLWGALRPALLAIGLAVLATAVCAYRAPAEPLAHAVAPEGVAMGGFDPVAYFTDGAAARGQPGIVLRWRGLTWHFASPAHRAAFEANPKAYLPEFGGFCPMSVGAGSPVPGNPEHWVILDGRLYLAAGPGQLAAFREHGQTAVQAARGNWTRRAGSGN